MALAGPVGDGTVKVVIYFPEDRLVGHSTDYRELHLDRIPLVGEHITVDDLDLTVRSVATIVEQYDDTTAIVRYDLQAS